MTEICDSFLRRCVNLTLLDVSPLKHLEMMDSYFLSGCTRLNLSVLPSSQVTEIRGNFLWGCSSLTALDLSSFSQVTKVLECFVRTCTGLTSVDLGALSHVKRISDSFLFVQRSYIYRPEPVVKRHGFPELVSIWRQGGKAVPPSSKPSPPLLWS